MKYDLTGERFGRLLVEEPAGIRARYQYWMCLCDCGKRTTVRSSHLLSGATVSCGCAKTLARSSHLLSKTPEYRAYYNIKKRCYDEKDTAYERYGGRGIRVCDRWLESFMYFYEDMGPRPGAGYSIDRINPNGDYSPQNCRWATIYTQARNRRARKDSSTGVRGVRKNKIGRYEASIYAGGKLRRIGTYSSVAEAEAARREAEKRWWGGDAQ